MTVDFYFRDGTYPGVQRVKALLEVQEKRLQAAINRDYDREVGKIAIYRSRVVYVYNGKYDLYIKVIICARSPLCHNEIVVLVTRSLLPYQTKGAEHSCLASRSPFKSHT